MLELDDVFEALKEMRKGDGLTVAKVKEVAGWSEVFGQGSPTQAFEIIKNEALKLTLTPSVVAANNALAVGFPVRRNITARRTALLLDNANQDTFGTDPRNLMRLEDKGLAELAGVLYELQADASAVSDDDLTALLERSLATGEALADMASELIEIGSIQNQKLEKASLHLGLLSGFVGAMSSYQTKVAQTVLPLVDSENSKALLALADELYEHGTRMFEQIESWDDIEDDDEELEEELTPSN